MMFSQIVQKTPSVYFKFDDSYQKHNFSKSSIAFDYSITNQKYSQAIDQLQSQRHKHFQNQGQTNFIFKHNKNVNGISCTNQTRNYQVHENESFQLNINLNVNNPNVCINFKSGRPNLSSLSKRKEQFICAPFELTQQDQLLQNVSSKLKTEQFFEQFQSNYVVTFQQNQHIFGHDSDFSEQQQIDHHELFTQQQYLSGHGPSSILNFDLEQRVKMIHIQSRKSLKRYPQIQNIEQNQQHFNNINEYKIQQQGDINNESFSEKNQSQYQYQHKINNQSIRLRYIKNQKQFPKQQQFQHQSKQLSALLKQGQNSPLSSSAYKNQQNQCQCQIDRIFKRIQYENSDKLQIQPQKQNKVQNKCKNLKVKIQQAKSPNIFNINFNNLHKNKNNSIIIKDFENNSNIFQMNPQSTNRKRVPLRNIGNILNKKNNNYNYSRNSSKNHSNHQKSTKGPANININMNENENMNHRNIKSQTRKNQIINGDLFISTINKNNLWTNPIQKKQSQYFQSLQRCSSWQKKDENLFKTTNAFKQTLKSTTLQNWKKKYHMKNLYEKKIVKRNINIFQKPFMVR